MRFDGLGWRGKLRLPLSCQKRDRTLRREFRCRIDLCASWCKTRIDDECFRETGAGRRPLHRACCIAVLAFFEATLPRCLVGVGRAIHRPACSLWPASLRRDGRRPLRLQYRFVAGLCRCARAARHTNREIRIQIACGDVLRLCILVEAGHLEKPVASVGLR